MRLIISFCFALIVCVQPLQATHVSSAEVWLEALNWVSTDSLRIRVHSWLYLDCAGINQAGSQPNASWISDFHVQAGPFQPTGTSNISGWQNPVWILDSIVEVSAFTTRRCADAVTLCQTGAPPASPNGVIRADFSAEFTVYVPPGGQLFSAVLPVCCRTAGIGNHTGASLMELLVFSEFEVLQGVGLVTGRGYEVPILQWPVGQHLRWKLGATTGPGENVRFGIGTAFDATNSPPIALVESNSIPATNYLLDSLSGDFQFTPTQLGSWLIPIEMRWYRNGQQVRRALREIVLTVTPPVAGAVGGPLLAEIADTVWLSPGQLFSDTAVVQWQGGAPQLPLHATVVFAPVNALHNAEEINSVGDSLNLDWQALPAGGNGLEAIGSTAFTFFVADSTCPGAGKVQQSIVLVVNDSLVAQPEFTVLADAAAVTLQPNPAVNNHVMCKPNNPNEPFNWAIYTAHGALYQKGCAVGNTPLLFPSSGLWVVHVQLPQSDQFSVVWVIVP